ncbi:hypothetical protein [Shewanella colwelliana]|uniref:hypothetical protein n=1 Tax=Shewanella colwelliana TaxID=23 RepID=UPI0009F3FB9B|nr:hypothetical protein [Shewanella colwelliana]
MTLFAAVQILLWLISGLYMVIMDIDFIRGKHLTHKATLTIPTDKTLISIEEVLRHFPGATRVNLYPSANEPRYQVVLADRVIFISAYNGQPVQQVTQAEAALMVNQVFNGSTNAMTAKLVTENAPSELNPRLLPVWQFSINDTVNTRLYISATSGMLVTQRHDYWRLFDIMWMLHIMDYEDREDIHNPLLSLMSLLALMTVLTGLALVFVAFANKPSERS